MSGNKPGPGWARRVSQGTRFLAAGFALASLVGCQPTVYLMPTPEVLQSGKHDPFSLDPQREHGNQVVVAYATNRLSAGPKTDRSYITLFDNRLRLGATVLRLGEEGTTWEDLHRLSKSGERDAAIPLEIEAATEMAVLGTGEGESLSPDAQAFFAAINDALSASLDKDLTIYVHGANNNFYRANAQAAQYRHFTGRNSVVLAYAWPSAESLLRYAVDVHNARKSAPVFARLLTLLAEHTKARRIDILAYSAGAQILSPALRFLSETYADDASETLKERLRLGEIYFAAPDVDFRQFVEDLACYIHIPDHVTLTVNPHDAVLGMAADHHGVSRAGRPDPEELTEEETQWVKQASRELPMDVIWITSNEIPGLSRGSHSFWYSHPWVSTDVLVQFLFDARPDERGLEIYEEEGKARVWYFPPDYPQRASAAIDSLKERRGLRLPSQ